ncbi:vacuolar protein sorting-associated protein 16 homolog isoform X1 [Varanus komodoensis]|uniref:vacuolar protein sorting-associated protein 16 homolog isoform X1 n=1 Tax=Varanus komodoensis TaxID=61221 RepID=UPI001CF7AB35|nr:vacuolar protein sorting-associated protein 16 homolog isoform X1 [Varanus komodoensis]
MDCYTANWDPLGEAAYYRKLDLYSMGWKLKEDLRDCLVAAAPYGGPIALLKTRKEKSPSSRPLLEIYSASGVLLASCLWKNSAVVQLGWTASEDLLCIQEDGSVLVYTLFCEFKRCFSLGNEVLQNHVLEAKVFHTECGTGLAVLTGAHRFTMVMNTADLKIRRLPEVPGLQKPPSCWTVLSQDRVGVILLAVGPDLYLLDSTACSPVTLPGLSPLPGSCLQMAVSFNYRYLALFTETGYVWMGRSHLKEKLGEFSCEFRTPPKQMAWCTRPRSKQRALVLAWERRLLVAGDGDQSIQYPLDEDSYLVPELDGVRIFSRSSHEFLHEIPEASQEIFKIASMAPGALLLEAQKEYEKESQKADEYLREIKDQKLLPEAVEQCIAAASHEHEPQIQKALLRAASFGKCFIDKFSPEGFVDTCRKLRVLNAIRDYQIAIPLTFDQYRQLTTQVLLDRLVLRRLYPIAIKISEYLRLSEFQGISRILAHWACYKVQQKDKSDEEVAQAINQKLGDTPGISYSEIAARAYDCGRPELAIKVRGEQGRGLRLGRPVAWSGAQLLGWGQISPGGSGGQGWRRTGRTSSAGTSSSHCHSVSSGGRGRGMKGGHRPRCMAGERGRGPEGDAGVPGRRVWPSCPKCCTPVWLWVVGGLTSCQGSQRTTRPSLPVAPEQTRPVLHPGQLLPRRFGTVEASVASRLRVSPMVPLAQGGPPGRGREGIHGRCRGRCTVLACLLACLQLLEYEPRSGEQVPLLLKMKRSQLALSKAIESGDTDLVYTVVLHLKNELNRGAFFMTLQIQPVALGLYRQFCKHQELDTLKDLYNQDDDHQELGNFHVRSSYVTEKKIEGRVSSLQNAVDEYYKAKNEFAAKATEDQIKLLRVQRRLQDDVDKPYLDLSLHDTVYNLILEGNHKRAEQLYRDFKIPDKRFWWLKISALAETGNWEELEKFSKLKKSPIGYLPFVEIAMKHHNRHEAKKFATRVAPEQRVKAFLLVGDLSQAADAAIERKSESEMNLILSKCTDATVTAKLNHAKAQIGKK